MPAPVTKPTATPTTAKDRVFGKPAAKPAPTFRRAVPTPAQELKEHQDAITEWGEKKGYFPPGTAAKAAAKPPLVARPSPGAFTAKAMKTPALPPIPEMFTDALVSLEHARLMKNSWTREFAKLEAEVKEAFVDLGRDTYSCEVTALDDKDEEQKATVTLEKIVGGEVEVETLDKELLKTLVTPEIYENCVVIQKGLVTNFAGDAILNRITTVEKKQIDGTIVTLASKKVKVAGKKK